MMNKINYFQFDNLVKNRVPFTLLNLGTSLVPLFISVYKAHVEAHEVMTDPAQALVTLDEKKVPKDGAVLVICQDGRLSSNLSMQLEEKGYPNVYLIDGGYQQLMTERSEA